MKRIRYGRIAALVAASALVLTACGNDPGGPSGNGGDTGSDQPSNLSGKLAGAGSSAQEAAMQAWNAGFSSSNPDVTISYDPAGSGAGRTQFGTGAIDWAGSDAEMKPDERTKADQRCGNEAIHLPVYISPIAVIYHVNGVKDLQLSPATVAAIFNRKITTWDDPKIKADNPGASLPSTRITPVNRSDNSGTTQNFTDYLAAAAPQDWPHDPSGDWPLSGGQSAQGTSGVVQTVQGGDGTIGYADHSQAGQLGEAKIKVGDEYVKPSADAAAKVVGESPKSPTAKGDHDLALKIKRTDTGAGTYPVVLVSYVIICQKYSDAAKNKLVNAFVSYIASEQGQKAAADAAGSAPITDKMRTDINGALDAMGAK